jgi:hypothetical protein
MMTTAPIFLEPERPRTSRLGSRSARSVARHPLDIRASLLAIVAGGEQVRVQARTRDLSPLGAGLTLTRPLPSGTLVLLTLRLPGGRGQLSLKAVIARHQGYSAGVHFVGPTAEQRLLLGELCCA